MKTTADLVKSWICYLACFALMPASIAAETKPVGHAPRFVTWVLAGFRLNNDSWIGVKPYLYDARTGYYFVSAEDCFGTPRSFTLCTKQKLAELIGPAAISDIPHGRLSLRAGNGVAIGDRRREVEARLGSPQGYLRGPGDEQTDVYRFDFPKRKGTWGYKATYTFRYDRLWAMSLERCWMPRHPLYDK